MRKMRTGIQRARRGFHMSACLPGVLGPESDERLGCLLRIRGWKGCAARSKQHLLPSLRGDCYSFRGGRLGNTWLSKKLGTPTTKISPGSPFRNIHRPTPLREEAWIRWSGMVATNTENPRWPQESGSASVKKGVGEPWVTC